jgi:hypothetical protein
MRDIWTEGGTRKVEAGFNIEIKKAERIEAQERESMYLLHTRYFSNVKRENFLRDLREKDWCILIRDGLDNIKGFSTMQLIDTFFEGRPVTFLFSGDTIVARENWHNNLLAGAFGHFMLYLNETNPGRELYWLLISKGFRTYRFLPVFYKEYYPACNRDIPERVKALMDHVCTLKFGSRYDRKMGLILSRGHSDYLKEHMAAVPELRKKNPHIHFFLEKNPYYYRGDELVCLASLNRVNFREEPARRVMRAVEVSWTF